MSLVDTGAEGSLGEWKAGSVSLKSRIWLFTCISPETVRSARIEICWLVSALPSRIWASLSPSDARPTDRGRRSLNLSSWVSRFSPNATVRWFSWSFRTPTWYLSLSLTRSIYSCDGWTDNLVPSTTRPMELQSKLVFVQSISQPRRQKSIDENLVLKALILQHRPAIWLATA